MNFFIYCQSSHLEYLICFPFLLSVVHQRYYYIYQIVRLLVVRFFWILTVFYCTCFTPYEVLQILLNFSTWLPPLIFMVITVFKSFLFHFLITKVFCDWDCTLVLPNTNSTYIKYHSLSIYALKQSKMCRQEYLIPLIQLQPTFHNLSSTPSQHSPHKL
jgi:hypothetical protein